MHCPAKDNAFQARHAGLLGSSFLKFLNRPLCQGICGTETFANTVYEAPFAVVSHGIEPDPVFNYANLKAMELFAVEWAELTQMPSRLSAEPLNRLERQKLLESVSQYGFIDHYQGVRISKNGKRFLIRNAVVWNLIDGHDNYQGQAACFSDWEFLD